MHSPPAPAIDPAKAGHPRFAPPRFRPLDVFRFVAVCLMVQGHAFTALLADRITSADWYRYHLFVHGFTAPMFLFGAGTAFAITTLRKWGSHVTYGPAMSRRLGRYAWILVIGYTLHFPLLRIRDWGHAPPGTFEGFFMVDALQVIGVTMVGCVILVWASQTPTRWLVATAAALGIVVCAAPAAWRLPVGSLPLPVMAYVNGHTGSLFPIFPWAGFVFAGVLTGALVARTTQAPASFSWALLAVGAAVLVLGMLADSVAWESVFGQHNRWESGPFVFVWRAGVLLLVLGLIARADAAVAPAHQVAQPAWTTRVVRTMSQESLVVYVSHLLLLYGVPGWGGFRGLRGDGFGLPAALGVVILLFVAGGAAALGFAWFRDQHPDGFRRVKGVALVGLCVALASRY